MQMPPSARHGSTETAVMWLGAVLSCPQTATKVELTRNTPFHCFETPGYHRNS